jgi:hypothetical protein
VNREPALVEAMSQRIRAHPTRRIPLRELIAAATAVDHSGAATAGWRTRVKTAITALADKGEIILPRTRTLFDRSSHPPLPIWVARPPTPAEQQKTAPTAPVWHAELSWAARLYDGATLSSADWRLLTAINAWLPRRRGIAVPMRERSLDIFGDEKLLETRITSPLFGASRLTLELLETFPCSPLVHQIVCGAGDWLLIENYTTYYSISNRARQLGFDGRIIWGSGKQVGTRLAALAAQRHPPRCFYFGDIDPSGFSIARSAAAKASQFGLPEITPARGLYALAHRHGTARPSDPPRSGIDWIRQWLGGELGERTATLIEAGKTIVQEYVGTEVLSTTKICDWFH